MHRTSSVFLMAVLSMPALAGQNPAPAQPGPIAFTGVTIVDVAAQDPARALVANQTVVVTGATISAVGETSRVAVPDDARPVDAAGQFLIPGLWDMHAHLLFEDRVDYALLLAVVNGVTGVRVPGSPMPPEWIRATRAAIDDGRLIGPRLAAVSARVLEGVGGRTAPLMLPIASPEEARTAVVSLKEQGADFVKPYNRLTRDVYLAIVDEARRQGIAVAGHVPMSMTATEVSDLGQKSIEHSGSYGSTPTELLMSCSREEGRLRKQWQSAAAGNPPLRTFADYETLYSSIEARAAATYDVRKAAALFARFVRNGTYHTPTLVLDRPTRIEHPVLAADARLTYVRASTRERWQKEHAGRMVASGGITAWQPRVSRRHQFVLAMHRAGVQILAGTDTMMPYVVPGFSLHEELALLVEAGLTPLESLRTATLSPAKFLGKSESMGTIERGKVADLVLLDANPLLDIANTRRIGAVVLNGRYLPRATLDSTLAEVESIVKREPTIVR
jgi:imidazolonepropionase-like amidohydrolase